VPKVVDEGVLARDVATSEAVPPFDNTAMDGFAVRASDTADASDQRPVELAIVGTVRAGMAPDVGVEPGQAVRIMTGAPIPPGADAVVMVERTTIPDDPTKVLVQQAVSAGNHVRPSGDDLQAGQLVFRAG
jgi:molybdopterin biosynthesis enzyme